MKVMEGFINHSMVLAQVLPAQVPVTALDPGRILHRELVYIWYYFELQLRQIFSYWILGMAIGSLISVFAKDRIHGTFARM